MSKRFFSLLLVLCMVLSLAMPAFASEEPVDAPAVAQTGDFRTDVDKDNIKDPDAKLLVALVDGISDWLNNSEKLKAAKDLYTSAAIDALTKAYNDAQALIDQYDTGSKDAAVAAIKATYNALNFAQQQLDASTSTVSDLKTALQSLIDEAKNLAQDDTLSTYGKGILNSAVTTAQTVVDNASAERKDFVGATKDLQDVIDEAKKCVNTVTVSLVDAGYEPAEIVSKNQVNPAYIYWTLATSGTADKSGAITNDSNAYTLKIKVGDKSGLMWEFDADDVKATAWPYGASGVTGEAYVQSKIADFKFTEGQTITLELYYDKAKAAGTYEEVLVGSKTITVSNAPVTFVAGAAGFAADNTAKGLPTGVAAEIGTQKDVFYVTANAAMKKAGTLGSGSYWALVSGGKNVKTIPYNENGVHADKKAVALKFEGVDLKVADYTVQLVGLDANKNPVAVASWPVSVPALDTADLKTLVDKVDNEMGGEEGLAANYGNKSAVRELAGYYETAKKDYLGETPKPATNDNITKLGHLKKADEKDPVGIVGNLEAAIKAVFSVKELREAIASVEALNPDDYNNWYTGLMAGEKGALYQAIAGLHGATDGKAVTSKQIVKDKETRITAAENVTSDTVAVLLANLNKAIAALDSKYADIAPLQALIDAAPTDSTKYTESSWKALQDAITAAKAVIAAKPSAADKAKVDDATAALQAAIKGLVPVTGTIEKVTGEDGKEYIEKDGEQVTGIQKVDGELYYASSKDGHVMKGGWINAGGGKKVYAGADGVLLTGYQVIGGKPYYLSVNDGHALKNGKVSAGKGVQYVAGADGVLAAGLAKVPSGEQYYCSVKDNHIMKAPAGKGTAVATGENGAKYIVNEKGVVVG